MLNILPINVVSNQLNELFAQFKTAFSTIDYSNETPDNIELLDKYKTNINFDKFATLYSLQNIVLVNCDFKRDLHRYLPGVSQCILDKIENLMVQLRAKFSVLSSVQ